jgi:hypothetical protein
VDRPRRVRATKDQLPPHDSVMIAKDFHSMKDFRQIRGKSFVITGRTTARGGLSGHIWHGQGRARPDKSL